VPKTIIEIIQYLKSLGFDFLIASKPLEVISVVPEGCTFINIMTPRMYQLSPKLDGGLAQDNFTLSSNSGQKRFAVICQITIVDGQIILHSSPDSSTRELTEKMCLHLNGTLGCEILDCYYCWEEIIPAKRMTIEC